MMNDQHLFLHKLIGNARAELEPQTADTSSTADAVKFIIQVKHFQRISDSWGGRVGQAKDVQELLKKHRYTFPQNWMEYGMLAGEWSAFQDMLNRKVLFSFFYFFLFSSFSPFLLPRQTPLPPGLFHPSPNACFENENNPTK